MRRIVLVALAAMTAAGLLVTPVAVAAPSDTDRPPAALAAAVAAQGRALEAAGFLAVHGDGVWTGKRGWYNEANGRSYYLKAKLFVSHDTNGEWSAVAQVACTRKYGNLEVDQRCNFAGTHHAVASNNGVSVNSVGNKSLGGSCVYSTANPGSWRAYGSSYPWAMSYIEDLQARFVTESCAHIHLTLTYDVGSYMVNLQTEQEINHTYTGAPGWTSPAGYPY